MDPLLPHRPSHAQGSVPVHNGCPVIQSFHLA
ncbi:Uncharacterised protein [Vibrio cholerae]|nr:Uncharacterised protein [Vibrio cholerae]CSI53485.1 Uncharacterised protein [Vibrio cholerae]